ncbi:uncharacterized protein LOC143236231 [Tachypleus tridentatus]|uniref:uncharacterized protein LOC143236231 n=1 Tax=Tachypleus tridentatus TaxID=6853 RepID=UPI003FD18C11
MIVHDGKSLKECPHVNESETRETMTSDTAIIPDSQVTGNQPNQLKNFPCRRSSLSLPRRPSTLSSTCRLDGGVLVRVDGSNDWNDQNNELQADHFRSPSAMSIISTESIHLEKSHRRKNHEKHHRSSTQDATGRSGDQKEERENSGHKKRGKNRHYLAPPSGENKHSRRHSMQVASQQAPVKMNKRKCSYPETEVHRADRRSSGSSSGHSRRSSRTEDLGRRSSRVPRRSNKSLENEMHEDVQVEERTERRTIIIYIICSVSLFILITSVVLVAVTLSLSPTIDQLGKKKFFKCLECLVVVTKFISRSTQTYSLST